MSVWLAGASGLLFGLGLILGGMTDPSKVRGFLDVFGRWDPSLAFVMGGAVAVGVVAFRVARDRTRAWSGEAMALPPPSRRVDARLVVGGLLFGLGWGLGGFCPGPAIVALGGGFGPAAGFVVAMGIGMAVHDRWLAPRPRPSGANGP